MGGLPRIESPTSLARGDETEAEGYYARCPCNHNSEKDLSMNFPMGDANPRLIFHLLIPGGGDITSRNDPNPWNHACCNCIAVEIPVGPYDQGRLPLNADDDPQL